MAAPWSTPVGCRSGHEGPLRVDGSRSSDRTGGLPAIGSRTRLHITPSPTTAHDHTWSHVLSWRNHQGDHLSDSERTSKQQGQCSPPDQGGARVSRPLEQVPRASSTRDREMKRRRTNACSASVLASALSVGSLATVVTVCGKRGGAIRRPDVDTIRP